MSESHLPQPVPHNEPRVSPELLKELMDNALQPTMQLRIVQARFNHTVSAGVVPDQLQQYWVNSKGHGQWRPVEIVYEDH